MVGRVTAVIPHIPPRADVLPAAVASVVAQTHPVDAISVAVDVGRVGSAATRSRALDAVTTEWVAFLDDDDVWFPHHIESLLARAAETGADVVYPYCVVVNEAGQKVWDPFGQPFDPVLLYQRPYITSVCMVRTGLAKLAGFREPHDEWGFYQRLHTNGAIFAHLPEITWQWNHNSRNTNGKPHNW